MKLTGTLILFSILSLNSYSLALEDNGSHVECIDDRVVTEEDENPECNLLSIPAREVTDPYVFAVSYFNYKMNIILRENIVSEFAYYDVPFYIYKSFMNSDSKEIYWEYCIKDVYKYELIY